MVDSTGARHARPVGAGVKDQHPEGLRPPQGDADAARTMDPVPAPVVKRTMAGAYDRLAAEFAAAADRYVYRYLARPLADALRGVDGAVLDVAAGTGAAGRLLPPTVALDLSIGQLQQNPAKRRIQADAEQLPFRADSFDAVVCAFGINHFPHPNAAVVEMARIAAVVGVTTWRRPAPPYAPKEAVMDALARRNGRSRTATGMVLDSLGDRVGSSGAVSALLSGAGMCPDVAETTVLVPWPGMDAFLDYRLAMVSTSGLAADVDGLREDVAAALATVPKRELDWQAQLVVGIGRRRRDGWATPEPS